MILPSHEVEDFRLLEAESRTPAYLPGGPYFPLTFGNFWGRDNVGLNQVHVIFDIGGTLHVKDDRRRLPESYDHYQPGIWEQYVTEQEGASEVVAMAVNCFGAQQVWVLSRAGRRSAAALAYWFANSDWLERTGMILGHLLFVPAHQSDRRLDLPEVCGQGLRRDWAGLTKRAALDWLRRNSPGAVFMAVDDREDQLEQMGPRWPLMMPSRYADRVDRSKILVLPNQPLIWMRALLRDIRFNSIKQDKRLTDLTARETLTKVMATNAALDLGFTSIAHLAESTSTPLADDLQALTYITSISICTTGPTPRSMFPSTWMWEFT